MALPFDPSTVKFAEAVRRQGELIGATVYFTDGSQTIIEGKALTDEVKQFLATFRAQK